MAIRVQFLADVVDYLRGSGKVTDATKDNAEGLEALMRKAILLGREIGKTTDEIALDLSRGFDVPLERAKRAVDEVADAAKDAGDEVDQSLSKGSARAGDSVSELGSIARDVLQGDFGAATESAASALMGLAGIIGGGAVGGAIATALGSVVGSWISEWNRAAEESAQRISDMYDDMAESGNRYLSQAYLFSAANELIADDGKLAKVREMRDLLGIDLYTAIGALTGSSADLAIAQQAVSDQLDIVGSKVQGYSTLQDEAAGKTQSAFAELQKLRGELEGVGDSLDTAGSKADALSGYQIHLYDAEVAAGRATKEIDAFGDAIYKMPDGKTVTVNAETGQATQAIQAIEEKQIPDKTAWVRLQVDDSEVQKWRAPMKVGSVQMQPSVPSWAVQLLGGGSDPSRGR